MTTPRTNDIDEQAGGPSVEQSGGGRSTSAVPPSRSTGLPPGVQTAPTGRRLLAYVIDHALPALLVAVSSGIAAGTMLNGRGRTVLLLVTIVVSLAWGLLVWRMYALRAAGPGMRVTGLQLVGYRDGRPIGWGRFLLRWLVLTLLTATGVGLVVMLVAMLTQVRRQGWHDLAAESVVIAERELAPPPLRRAGTTTTGTAPDERVSPAPAAEPATPAASTAEAVAETAALPPLESPTTLQPAEWLLVFDDGWDLGVDGLVLLGRNPQPQAGEEHAQLVKIADTTRTVSKTHLAVGVDPNGVYVMDRGSTNGSTVTTPDGFSLRCTPGDVTGVEDGTIVSFGDHWFRVTRAPE